MEFLRVLVSFAAFLISGVAQIAILSVLTSVTLRTGLESLNGNGLSLQLELFDSKFFWGSAFSFLGYLSLPFTGLLPGIVSGVILGMTGLLGAETHTVQKIENFVLKDKFLLEKVALTVIFLCYMALRWWSIRKEMLVGIEPIHPHLRREVSIFVLLNVLPQLIVLLYGLLGILVLQISWRKYLPNLKDAVTELKEEKYREKIETIESRNVPFLETGGALIAGAGLLWLLVSSSSQDIIRFTAIGVSIIGLFMVLATKQEISDLRKAELPEKVIQKKINRDGAALAFQAATALICLLGIAFVLDRTLGFYYIEIMANSANLFSEQVFQQLQQTSSPSYVVDYYSFYGEGVIFDLSLRYFRLFFPLILIISLLPFMLKKIFIQNLSEMVKALATYVLFTSASIFIETFLTGEGIKLNQISFVSLIPAAGSALSDRITDWLKDQIGYIDCKSCGKQVSSEGRFCEFCGKIKSED